MRAWLAAETTPLRSGRPAQLGQRSRLFVCQLGCLLGLVWVRGRPNSQWLAEGRQASRCEPRAKDPNSAHAAWFWAPLREILQSATQLETGDDVIVDLCCRGLAFFQRP